jgi:hypothetical protein
MIHHNSSKLSHLLRIQFSSFESVLHHGSGVILNAGGEITMSTPGLLRNSLRFDRARLAECEAGCSGTFERCTEPSCTTRTLAGGAVYGLEARAGDTMCVTSGDVWLTQSGDSTDYILRGGETFHASRRGRIVVQAMTPASIDIQRGDTKKARSGFRTLR